MKMFLICTACYLALIFIPVGVWTLIYYAAVGHLPTEMLYSRVQTGWAGVSFIIVILAVVTT